MCAYALLASRKAEMLLRRGFDVDARDVAFKHLGNVFAHFFNIRRDPRLLNYKSRVDITYDRSPLIHEHLDARQQSHARYSLVFIRGIGKMLSDIAKSKRADDRIHYGVDQNVGVGMPVKSKRVRNGNAAKDQCNY